MALSLKKTLRIELVREKGVLNTDATLEAFADLLEAQQTSERMTDADKATINAALDKFLAANKQAHFPLDVIAQVVTNRHLDVPLDMVSAITEKVKAYIRSDNDRFYIGRGKNGGCRIVSRMTAEEKVKWEKTREAEVEAESAAQ